MYRSRPAQAPGRCASSSYNSRRYPYVKVCAADSIAQWLGYSTRGTVSHRLVKIRIRRVGRAGKYAFQFRADRRVEIEPLGRDLLHEPFVVQLKPVGALVERRGGSIDHLLEGRIVLAQHDAVGLGLRERILRDYVG